MAARKGLTRLIRVCLVVVAFGYGAWWLYDYLFQPAEIKRRVHEALSAKFEGVDVEIGSARMRPFLGGVNVTDLKLIRRDDPTRTPFLHVPSAIIWHDKADFSRRFSPAKIELEDAHLRLIRETNGKWNVEGLAKPPSGSGTEPAPILVLKKARVEVIDRKAGTTAILDLKDTDVTVVNDPLKVYTVEAKGSAHPLGPFVVRARYEAGAGATGTLDLNGIHVGADLGKLIGQFAPEAADQLAAVSGTATARAKFDWQPTAKPAVRYDVAFELRDGRCESPNLPAPMEHLAIKARAKNGDVVVESLTGNMGAASVSVKLELDGPTAADIGESGIEDRLRKLDVTVTDLEMGPALFEKLPPSKALTDIREMFAPAGPVDITYEMRREAGVVRKTCVLQPKGLSAKYRGFPYPVDHIRGTVVATIDEGVPPRYEVDLVGEGGGQAVTLKGRVIGKPEKDIDLVLKGSDIVLDPILVAALPGEYPTFVRGLGATAMGDFTAKLRHNAKTRRDHGPEVFDNEFDIDIRQGSLMYEGFPYPLGNLSGNLKIRTVPDRPTMVPGHTDRSPTPAAGEIGSVKFTNFKATGPGGCRLTIDGGKEPEPGGMLLTMAVTGSSVPLDRDLFRAAAKIKLDAAWRTFDLGGRMNCDIRVRVHDRDGPTSGTPVAFEPARDLELAMAFNGPSIRPSFFPFQVTDAAGQLSYARGQVDLWKFVGRHGATTVSLPGSEKVPGAVVLIPPGGGFYAKLSDLKIDPIVFDRDLLAALPTGLRSAFEGLELRGSVGLHARLLVIDDTPKGEPSVREIPQVAAVPRVTARATLAALPRTALPTIYWDGTLTFRDASFKTGVPWDSATGQLSSRGLYVGDRLGRVVANLGIARGRVLKQPVEMLAARFEVDPKKPDIVSVPSISGKVYGGDVGGQARLELSTPLRFDLSLNGARLRLEDFARVNNLGPKTHAEGLATAQLSLSNAPDATTRSPLLQGSGSIDVPDGRLLDLPVLLDVIKLARLRPMDHTAFEEAHAVFRIRGNRLKFGQLDLLGNAISLGGDGEMNLDGTNAAFQFYTVWTNIRSFLGVGGEIPALVSSNLYKIRVSGDLGSDKPKVVQEPLPLVLDPVRRLLGRANK